MALTNLPKAKLDTSEKPKMLNKSEIESLRQNTKTSLNWMANNYTKQHRVKKNNK